MSQYNPSLLVLLLLRRNTVLVAALQLCSKSLTSSLSDCNVWDNPHVPCGKNAVRTAALLPSRAERDELKWLISIIWLVQLHKHAPILASVSVFCLSVQPRPWCIRLFILPDQFLCHPLYCCEWLDLSPRWSDFHARVSAAWRREAAHVL